MEWWMVTHVFEGHCIGEAGDDDVGLLGDIRGGRTLDSSLGRQLFALWWWWWFVKSCLR